MPMLITGFGGYEEHGDCSELKREIHIEKHGRRIIDLLPKCYEEERRNLIQKIHYKYMVDLATICIIKSYGKLYLIKFKEQSMIKDGNINKILNAEYKVVSNNHCKSYIDWINFHKSTEGQYKVGDNILIDSDN